MAEQDAELQVQDQQAIADNRQRKLQSFDIQVIGVVDLRVCVYTSLHVFSY